MHPSARRSAPAPAGTDSPSATAERRREARLTSAALGLDADARLGDAVRVRIINVSPGGALVEQPDWVRPGTQTELHLLRKVRGDHPERLSAQGTVLRSWVHRVTPLMYRSAILFERPRARAAKAALPATSADRSVAS